jgi:hypothetical protein
MLIDFGRALKTLRGSDLVEGGEVVTIGGVACNIIAALPTDTSIPASERKKRFVLSVRIMQADRPIEVDEADAALMARLINASSLPPLFSEQIVSLLEGRPNPLDNAR